MHFQVFNIYKAAKNKFLYIQAGDGRVNHANVPKLE